MEKYQSNPFPGINPFLELQWADIRISLIVYISDALSQMLPEDLRSLAEENLSVKGALQKNYRADVAVVESSSDGFPPLWQPNAESGMAPVVAAEPEIILVGPETQRWIEIRDRYEELVTVIEVLSPSNKISQAGREQYRAEQQDLLSAGVNLVEIDLIRQGSHVITADESRLRPNESGETRYIICAVRARHPDRHEVYYCPLRDPLPTIRIPLRPFDPDVPLTLQPLIDRTWRTGRCWHLNHRANPPGPDWSESECQWIDEKLIQAGLR
ncbi:MAG: DUF4058 family protein [Verrucomicrobiae bacterium]|nr:DUF4058 family protein [Verrucomicrobiae bacterium]